MGLFKFKSNKKNEDLNRNTTTSADKLLDQARADTLKYNESLQQALDNTIKILSERTEPEAVTKQRMQAWIQHRISEASKLINQNWQLLETNIFQEWAKLNNISPDVSYARSFFKNLSLEQLQSLNKFVCEKCKELECNFSNQETFQEDEQQEQTRNGQQNTDKVDSPIPTENPIVPDENNINEETTQIDLNEIYKELNTTENELISKWSEEEFIPSIKSGSRKYIEFKEWVIEYYKDNLENKPRSR